MHSPQTPPSKWGKNHAIEKTPYSCSDCGGRSDLFRGNVIDSSAHEPGPKYRRKAFVQNMQLQSWKKSWKLRIKAYLTLF